MYLYVNREDDVLPRYDLITISDHHADEMSTHIDCSDQTQTDLTDGFHFFTIKLRRNE